MLPEIQTADVIANAHEDREAWLVARRSGIGASEMPAIMGVSPYAGPLAVWESKRRTDTEPMPTEGPLARGLALEPVAMQMFANARGVRVVGDQRLLRSRARPWQLATLDARADGVPIQIKTALFNGSGERQLDHEVQCQQEMDVSGEPGEYLAILEIQSWRMLVFELLRNDEFLEATLRPTGERFWSCVQSGIEPSPDTTDASLAAWKRLHPRDNGETVELPAEACALVDVWEAKKSEAKELQAVADQAKVRLMGLLGDATFGALPDGRVLKLPTIEKGAYTVAPQMYRQLGMKKGGRQ